MASTWIIINSGHIFVDADGLTCERLSSKTSVRLSFKNNMTKTFRQYCKMLLRFKKKEENHQFKHLIHNEEDFLNIDFFFYVVNLFRKYFMIKLAKICTSWSMLSWAEFIVKRDAIHLAISKNVPTTDRQKPSAWGTHIFIQKILIYQ